MNNGDSFAISAVRPTQIAIVIYAVIKQIFVTLFVEEDNWIYRLIISIVWLFIVFIVTNSKKPTRRQVSLLVLTTTVLQEIVYFTISRGDRMIFIFLIGCSLLSIMYADQIVMLVTMFLSTIAISFCIFVLGIKSTVGFEFDFIHDVFNVVGLIMINIVIFLIGKYTIVTLANARQEAEDASKVKSNFLAKMSHEIRTPMNAIIGISQIQLQKENLPDEYASALIKINHSGTSLLGIINDILDLSKIETGKMMIDHIEYDLPNLINDTVQLNIVQIGSKPIEFLLDIDEKLPSRLIGDELRIKQILNNLLSNAIKYTEKGYVKLSLSHTVQETASADRSYINLEFIIEDSGQGMKSEDLEKLFSEYMRFNIEANKATEGTGIGLNITRSLVELMEGTITAKSEYGKGSIFKVNIKQKALDCPAIGAEVSQRLCTFTYSTDKQNAYLQKFREPMPYGKVLIVDDVETNLFVAEGLLSAYELQIEKANSGYQTIEKVRKSGTYDIIFMDHMMPLMDGVETTQRLRAMGYKGIIVALTANALVGNAEMFKQNGFDDFISKPIDIMQLNALLNKFIRDIKEDKAGKQSNPGQKTAINSRLLDVFRRDAEKAIITLRQTVSGEIDGADLKLFTTTVHAMKSALANIGEINKSSAASALEEAGLKSDIEFINANIGDFIESLEELIPKEAKSEENTDQQEDTAYLMEQLQIIKKACEDYNDTAAYAALDRLKEKPWKTSTSISLGEIHDTLFLRSDFDAAVELTGKLVEDKR